MPPAAQLSLEPGSVVSTLEPGAFLNLSPQPGQQLNIEADGALLSIIGLQGEGLDDHRKWRAAKARDPPAAPCLAKRFRLGLLPSDYINVRTPMQTTTDSCPRMNPETYHRLEYDLLFDDN